MKMLLCSMGVVVALAGSALPGAAQGQPVSGFLMDNACSSMHASEAGYAENHDKKCLLMDACVKSGYSLVLADKRVLKFDAKGNQLALDLVKKTEREKNWAVAVTGTVSGSTIAVTDIKLR